MARQLPIVLVSAALLLAGCEGAANLAAATIGAQIPGGAAAFLPVSIEGRVFVTADQVAIIAGGAGNIVGSGGGNIVGSGGGNVSDSPGGFAPNFGLLARSDETGLANGTVKLEDLAGKQPAITAQTDASGRFTVEGKGNTNYKITANVKNGTLTGLALARALKLSVELDCAHHMAVGSLLAEGTPANLDAAKFEELLVVCRAVMQTVSKAPTMNSMAEAKAQWDKLETPEMKAKRDAVKAAPATPAK